MNKSTYKEMFERAIQHIKIIRSPHAEIKDNSDLKWTVVKKMDIFDFGSNEYDTYSKIIKYAKDISIKCVLGIIIKLGKEYRKDYEIVTISKDNKIENLRYMIIDNNKTLFIFKDIEKCSFWKSDKEPKCIEELMKTLEAKDCKYIYFMFEAAYLQVIGHNDDENDPGRGTNVYSLIDFFLSSFGEEETIRFKEELLNYIESVRKILGFISVKSLYPDTLINFKKITKYEILNYRYDLIVNKLVGTKKYKMVSSDFQLLKQQFIDLETYKLLLGNSDFSESFITAEWLYRSMKQAHAVDLTIIGMGYCKAVEQLLYDLIKINKKGKTVKEDDYSIGAIATFYKRNQNLYRTDIDYYTKTYIKEKIFAYGDLRNEYFHKNNIHDINKIDEIRIATFDLIFLVLGSHNLSDKDLEDLGMLDDSYIDDYYTLCEYMNYHAGNLFFVSLNNNKLLCFACNDHNTKTINDNYIQYSGVYLKEINSKKIIKFSKDNVPEKISLAKLNPSGKNRVKFNPVEVERVFENGIFLGTPIAESEINNY